MRVCVIYESVYDSFPLNSSVDFTSSFKGLLLIRRG
jgi:hypothetical protein